MPAQCTAPACGQPSPHARLCRDCADTLRRALHQVHPLAAELRAAYARLDRIGPRQRGGSGGPAPMPYREHAAEALAVLSNVVVAWAWTLHAVMPAAASAETDPARYLAAHLARLARQDWAGQALDEIADAVDLGWRTVDLPPEQLLAGVCGCGARIYAERHASAVRCPSCDTGHDVNRQRARMLDQAADTLVTQREALAWAQLLADQAVPRGTFRSWVSRGRLRPRCRTADGTAYYRFGDVQALLAATPRRSAS